MNKPELTIKERISVTSLKLSVLGMRHRAAIMATDLIYTLIKEFEESGNAGVEFEDLTLTATFKPARKKRR